MKFEKYAIRNDLNTTKLTNLDYNYESALDKFKSAAILSKGVLPFQREKVDYLRNQRVLERVKAIK